MLPSDKLVYDCIARLVAERGTMYVTISNPSICKLTHLSERTVARSLKRLLTDCKIYWQKPAWSDKHNRRKVARYRLLNQLDVHID
jgi:hypothetical protein